MAKFTGRGTGQGYGGAAFERRQHAALLSRIAAARATCLAGLLADLARIGVARFSEDLHPGMTADLLAAVAARGGVAEVVRTSPSGDVRIEGALP
ncbi:MAG: hypothetical protein HYZ29_25950 [Myxococcales bacterium]|nr:hypothetical protein [Myxococcales bacterium]